MWSAWPPLQLQLPWVLRKVTVKSSTQVALGRGTCALRAQAAVFSAPQFPRLSTWAFQNRHLPGLGALAPGTEQPGMALGGLGCVRGLSGDQHGSGLAHRRPALYQ